MEEVENEAEHGRSEAVAEAADTRDHPLDQTLQHKWIKLFILNSKD